MTIAPETVSRDAVAVSTHLNIAIPGSLAVFEVGSVISDIWQWLEMESLPLEAFCHHFLHRSLHTQIRFFLEPLLCQLVEMHPALETAIADKEVLLDITHHAFIPSLRSGQAFALRACPIGPATSGCKPVVSDQIDKAFIEFRSFAVRGPQHRTLLVVHQHFCRDTP